jgi:putative ABC transport system permease protein
MLNLIEHSLKLRPRWQKVLTDLWSNKTRSALVIASIGIGLFAVGMITTTYEILMSDMGASYARVNPANIQVRAAGFDPAFPDRIKHLPGVQDANGATSLELRLKTAQDQYIAFNIKAIPNIDEMTINKVDLVAGTWPPGDHEIVIDKNRISDTRASLGSEVEIKLPSGTVRKMRVVGIVQDQTIGSASGGGGFFLAPAQGYVTYETLDWLERSPNLNMLYVTVAGNPDDLDTIRPVASRILEEFDRNGYQILNSVTRRLTDHPNSTYLDAISAVLFVLGLLVVFLSGFLITNTLSALLNQQIQQVGVMKTIGASRRQIIGVYMVLILSFSLIALLVAIPLSYLGAFAELEFLAQKINFNLQGHRVVPLAIIAQSIIALLVPPLAGVAPILQGARISIQEAINGIEGAGLQDQGVMYQLLIRVRSLPRPLILSLRNTFRRKVRLILTLLTLVLGGAIFIATFNVRGALDQYIGRLGKYFIADLNLTFDRSYRISEIESILQQVPEVVSVEGWAAARAEIILENDKPGESINLQAPPFDSKLIEPIMLEGRWISPGDENAIVLSEMFYEYYPQLKVGDIINLKVDGDKTPWVVVGFFQFAGKSSGLFAYTNYSYLSRLTHNSGKSFMYRVVAGDGYHSLETQKELGRRLEAYLDQQGYKLSDVRTGLSLQESTSGGLDTLTTFLMIMALLMASVGSIGLTGTMSLNVMERTREIGIMRSIGASDRAILYLVIIEGLTIALLSWVLACFAAVPISKVMSDAISMAIFNTPIDFVFTLSGILIWLVLVLALAALACVIPARSATRLTIREVLAYE